MDSKLQIISGRFKGRKLALPPQARPTQNRARIALFNMLDSIGVDGVGDFMVWDAFAGSGAFGLECVSRFPNARVLFTDVAVSSINTIKKNLGQLNVGTNATVLMADALNVVEKYAKDADIIFLDPPYSQSDLGVAIVNKLKNLVKKDAIIIWEQDSTNVVMPNDEYWEILRDKKYGRARFLIMQRI